MGYIIKSDTFSSNTLSLKETLGQGYAAGLRENAERMRK